MYSHQFAEPARSLAAAFLIAALMFLVGVKTASASEERVGEPAIPPGREDVLAKILGRDSALPGECKLFGILINQKIIEAEYLCSSGKVTFELVHPSQAADDDLQTQRFAIGLKDGSPPDTLREAVAAIIRHEESAFEWIWPEEEDLAPAAAVDDE